MKNFIIGRAKHSAKKDEWAEAELFGFWDYCRINCGLPTTYGFLMEDTDVQSVNKEEPQEGWQAS